MPEQHIHPNQFSFVITRVIVTAVVIIYSSVSIYLYIICMFINFRYQSFITRCWWDMSENVYTISQWTNEQPFLRNQYYGCWRSAEARSQLIRSRLQFVFSVVINISFTYRGVCRMETLLFNVLNVFNICYITANADYIGVPFSDRYLRLHWSISRKMQDSTI